MSLDALLWATNDAPIANVNEFAVLMMLAEKADPDGCDAFPSRLTMAGRTKIDPKTVLRTLQSLEERRLIAKGNQSATAYLRADRRPVVYDLMIPYSWFPNIERTNRNRQDRGRPPLTPADRPDLPPAPEKKRRSDQGKKRGDSQSPRPGTQQETHGVTTSPARGDSQSGTRGLQVTRTSSLNQPTRTSPDAPSARSALGARSASTSGSSAGEDEGGSAASSKNQPGLLSDKTPAPAGRPKAKRLGHSREQLRQAAEVCDLFPAVLGVRLVPALTDAILEALAGDVPGAERTAVQLGVRIERRWNLHGYAEKFHAGALESPVGAAIGMVRPLKGGDRYGCADPRCEDGADVDTGQSCTVCPERLADRRAARYGGADGRRAAGRRQGAHDPRADGSQAQETSTAPEEAYAATRMPQPVAEPPTVPSQFVPAGDYVAGAAAARAIMQDHKSSARRRTNLHGEI